MLVMPKKNWVVGVPMQMPIHLLQNAQITGVSWMHLWFCVWGEKETAGGQPCREGVKTGENLNWLWEI